MMASTKWADDGVFGVPTELYGVTEGVAMVTLPNEGKRVKKFDNARCAEEEERSSNKALKPGPVLVKESKEDR